MQSADARGDALGSDATATAEKLAQAEEEVQTLRATLAASEAHARENEHALRGRLTRSDRAFAEICQEGVRLQTALLGAEAEAASLRAALVASQRALESSEGMAELYLEGLNWYLRSTHRLTAQRDEADAQLAAVYQRINEPQPPFGRPRNVCGNTLTCMSHHFVSYTSMSSFSSTWKA